jgi:hypothetical protein
VSFQVPEGLTLAVGDRVDFNVKHTDGKAVVTTVAIATAPAPPTETASNAKGERFRFVMWEMPIIWRVAHVYMCLLLFIIIIIQEGLAEEEEQGE